MHFYNHFIKYSSVLTFVLYCLSTFAAEGVVERAKYEKGYTSYLKEYSRQSNSYRSPASNRRLPSSKSKVKIKKLSDSQQYAGLIYFKKGDMQSMCHDQVTRSVQMGLDGVVLYYPVHYSGGNSEVYKMPEKPLYGVHYKYELANRPTKSELNRCLDLILSKGLKLNFAPHLESVRTLVAPNKPEWRLMSGIPLDDKYLESAFGDFLTYLSSKKNLNISSGRIKLTAFSEIDPMVLSYPKRSYNIILNLKKKFNAVLGHDPEVIYNTNGDFYNGWNLPQSRSVSSCFYLKKLLNELDVIAPSIYGDKGHIGFEKVESSRESRATLGSTLSLFESRFNERLNTLCGEKRYNLRIEKNKLSFGEFALDENDSRQSYKTFFEGAQENLKFINYWNHGKWDHHGIYNGNTSSERFFKELTTSN